MTEERRLCPWCYPDPSNELREGQETCGARCRQRKSRWLKNHPDGIMPWEIDDNVTGVTEPGHSVTAGNEVLLAMGQSVKELLEALVDLAEQNNELLKKLTNDRPPQPRPLQPVIPPPPDKSDTEEIEIRQASVDVKNKSDWNFQIQTAKFIHGNYDSLPPEIIEYGMKTGRIQ